ncbi:MAG: hypothetical protein H6R26_132, partial [Proteobacteria bacterium]|nr:hypothetical protein [Pseudomonadota bacterium]
MTLSALIERLTRECGLPVLDREGVIDFSGRHESWALCFFNDPRVYPENLDLAVILPEILKGFPSLAAAIADPGASAELARE